MKTKRKQVLVPSSWLGPGQCKQGSAAVVPSVTHNNCVQAHKNEPHTSNPQVRRSLISIDCQIKDFCCAPWNMPKREIILPVRDKRGWILKHDILAAARCRVPTDLNLETHIKLWRMCSDLKSFQRRRISDRRGPGWGGKFANWSGFADFEGLIRVLKDLKDWSGSPFIRLGAKCTLGEKFATVCRNRCLSANEYFHRLWTFSVSLDMCESRFLSFAQKKLMISHFRNSYQVSTFCLPQLKSK